MTPYQERMTSFVWTSRTYSIGAAIAIYYYDDKSVVAWLVYASTLFIIRLLAIGFDAVYDSLVQRKDEKLLPR